MKNKFLLMTFFVGLLFCVSFFMPQPSFAFDLYGWWRAETTRASVMPQLFMVDKETFCREKYQIIKESSQEVQILIGNKKNQIKIQINGENNITIYDAFSGEKSYNRITNNATLTRKEVEKIFKSK